ncbi:rod shape-determining protein MreD [Berryella wangjianweii]|uniref:Rod shape-determining protein MreD n=2 Tax=Berryella wangjianweii TaxID=2734634 RepID=A0A6M8J3U3_9ACTN|nr:rod shape-determining protein MreD [Berryella wangjianweii]
MNMSHHSVIAAACVAVGLLLQVLVAPHVGIARAYPHVPVALMLGLSLARPGAQGPLAPFVAGITFDLVTGAPLGAMTFSLTLVCAAASRVFAALDNDSLLVPGVLAAVGCLACEGLFGAFMLAGGYQARVGSALAGAILPTALYTFALAVAAFLVLRALAPRGASAVPTNVSNVR